MKKIIAALSLILASTLLPVATAAPAQAAYGTDVTHASNDSGYSAPIVVQCRSGKILYLYTGDRSAFGTGPSCTYSGVQRILVASGQRVYCQNGLPPFQSMYFYANWYNEVPSWASLKCWMQRA